jgi:hypothetical protein
MRRLFLAAGALTAVAMLAISMRLNFLFGYSLGQTVEKAWVFGCVSIVSDAWKGLGPVFILVIFREKRVVPAIGAGVIWVACFVYSITSALGIAIEDRTARTGTREAAQLNYREAQIEIERLEQKRSSLQAHRSDSEVEAAVHQVLARTVVINQRIRGTVASLSDDCKKADARTADACADIARLRQELAAAQEEKKLDERLHLLHEGARALRERGASRAADPQAELLARLSRGWFAVRDVGAGLSVLLALLIELISAFGPAVLASYAEATAKPATAASAAFGSVSDYLAARIEPAADDAALSLNDLHRDYEVWCGCMKRTALPLPAFAATLDRVRQENGLRKIRKRKDSYRGISLKRRRPTRT